jgi:SAM-dependent methyltransferase
MNTPDNYISLNKESWNNKVEHHINSDFYDMLGFLAGNTSLNEIELSLLGNVSGKSILHLQCHFGQDTISLGRMGAHVTGIDFSEKAMESATALAAQTGIEASFICCNIYDLPQHLSGQYDIVYTSYGTIGWLPDLSRWAQIISHFLKPGGRFIFAEFHPVVWMFDDNFEKIGYNYFNDGPLFETENGTYADRSANITQQYINWNHSISEVLNHLIANGLQINSFNEYDYSPYSCFKHVVEFAPKKFRIAHLDNRIPMVYSLAATKI